MRQPTYPFQRSYRALTCGNSQREQLGNSRELDENAFLAFSYRPGQPPVPDDDPARDAGNDQSNADDRRRPEAQQRTQQQQKSAEQRPGSRADHLLNPEILDGRPPACLSQAALQRGAPAEETVEPMSRVGDERPEQLLQAATRGGRPGAVREQPGLRRSIPQVGIDPVREPDPPDHRRPQHDNGQADTGQQPDQRTCRDRAHLGRTAAVGIGPLRISQLIMDAVPGLLREVGRSSS